MAALAFLLDRALEKKLKAAGLSVSAAPALQALRTVPVVDFQVGPAHQQGTTSGSFRARQVLSALGITDCGPTHPRKEICKAGLLTSH